MSDSPELDLLREFYVAWVDLHKIPRDKLHRRKQEVAAQKLVDCGHALKFFYKGGAEETARLQEFRKQLEVVRG